MNKTKSLLTPDDFWRVFIEVMRNPSIPDFVEYYNNVPSKYRAPNIRPRTDVMLKSENSVLKSVLKLLLKRGFLPPDEGETSAERYIDFSYAVGNWWTGEKDFLLAVEVENDWAELKGTILDLLRFQARTKVAVFYSTNPRNHKDELKSVLEEVVRNFLNQGFEEAKETSYLLIIAPEMYVDGSLCTAYAFTGLRDIKSGCWLEEHIW